VVLRDGSSLVLTAVSVQLALPNALCKQRRCVEVWSPDADDAAMTRSWPPKRRPHLSGHLCTMILVRVMR
jgi:hypothetical protein